MCGRTRCTLRADDFPRACNLNGRPVRHVNMDRYRPAYNVSPGFNMPVIRREDGHGHGQGQGQQSEEGVVLQCMKWGLVPSFTKKAEKPDHYKMFNARSESVREKASFRRLIPTNRCLVAVEGFYEWKKDGSKKQPYYIYFKDGRALVIAALFDSWISSEGDVLYTFTILTTSSSSTLGWLHDRMPVILGNKESTETWLNGPSSNLDSILKPYGGSDLAWYPVTPAVGKASFDGPDCIKEIQLKTDETRSISQFFSKKGSNSQPDSELASGTAKKEPAEIDQPKSLNDEIGSQDSKNYQPIKSKDGDDIKPNASRLPREGAIDIPMKQEYDELSADTEYSGDGDDKLHASPLPKKLKVASDEKVADQKEKTKEPSPDRNKISAASSERKKATGTSDKQPTLFSYFGKG